MGSGKILFLKYNMVFKYKRKPMKKARRAVRKAGASKSMVSLIKQISSKQTLRELETKYVTTSTTATFNSTIETASEMHSLIPPVSPPALPTNAAQDWERENNDITPMMCKTTWHLALTQGAFPTQTNRSMNIVAVLYCLQAKSIRYFPDLGSAYPTAPAFLKDGISTQTTKFLGLPVHSDIMINNEEFTLLHKKKFHLCKNNGYSNGDVTGGHAPNVNGVNSYREHSFSYKVPKQLRYAPGTGNVYPDGHAPFWVIGYYHVDGSAIDVVEQDLTVSWTTQMTYKDA